MTTSAAAVRQREGGSVALITITVMLGLIMAIIDTTIVNVAINTIGGNLGATVDEVAWVATGYILANVVVMPLNGWLTALLGRKTFYATSLAVFTIASFFCGTARSIWVLVFYRIVQGLGGGALQPTAQAIMFETFPPERRGAAMAIFGMGAMVGPAIGPALGGWIVDNANWPLIFYINVPIGIAAFLMTLAFIPDPKYIAKPKGGIDWIGLSLLTAGLSTLQFVLEQGERDEWFSSRTIQVCALVSVLALVSFVVKSLRDRHPIVDLKVFKFRSFSVGSFLGIVMGFGLYGTALILPLFFQSLLGFTAFDTGLALMPGAFSTAISMLIIGRILNRVERQVVDRLRDAALRLVELDARRAQRAGGLLGRLLAASDPGLRFGLPFRAADDDLARRRPGSRDGRRDRRLHAAAPTRGQPRHRNPHDDADAQNRDCLERLGFRSHAVARLLDRPAHANGEPAIGDDRLQLSVPRDGDRLRALNAAHLLDQEAETTSRTGDRRRRIA